MVKYFGGGLFALCPNCVEKKECPSPCIRAVNTALAERSNPNQPDSKTEQCVLPLDPSSPS